MLLLQMSQFLGMMTNPIKKIIINGVEVTVASTPNNISLETEDKKYSGKLKNGTRKDILGHIVENVIYDSKIPKTLEIEGHPDPKAQ